jgi:tRNA-dihydrouridine synthase A
MATATGDVTAVGRPGLRPDRPAPAWGRGRQQGLERTLSVAPMMDCTDRFCRRFLRLITRHSLLYTEMITSWALLQGDREHLLRFDPAEHPVALQLGGSTPSDLAACARLGQRRGYDEINLNVGCPSDRVQSGRFGACLMAHPGLVADCVRAMRDAVTLPVTVKHRIGVDRDEGYGPLRDFVGTVAQAGCEVFVVHARKAWLDGLSPKENRTVPPLRYELVRRLQADFPGLQVVINGGITSLAQARELLRDVDGVMIGRAAYHDPWLLADADRQLYGATGPSPNRRAVVEGLLPFVEREIADGTPLGRISRHILGLYQGVPGARAWRRYLSTHAHRPGAGADVLRRAAALVPD